MTFSTKESSHGVESGMTFGSRTVLGCPFRVAPKCWMVVVQCDCGRIDAVWCVNLSAQKSEQCPSCRTVSRNYKHGYSSRDYKERLYTIWCNMRARCNNPTSPAAEWYGDKGVRLCDDWNDYEKFRNWALANGYQDHLTIDRVNSNGNYEPNNCEWVTREENTNRRNLQNVNG